MTSRKKCNLLHVTNYKFVMAKNDSCRFLYVEFKFCKSNNLKTAIVVISRRRDEKIVQLQLDFDVVRHALDIEKLKFVIFSFRFAVYDDDFLPCKLVDNEQNAILCSNVKFRVDCSGGGWREDRTEPGPQINTRNYLINIHRSMKIRNRKFLMQFSTMQSDTECACKIIN